MSKTSVDSDLFQSLNIVSELSIEGVGEGLSRLSISNILLSVEQPLRDLELLGVRQDGNNLVDFSVGEFSGSLVKINIGLLQQNVGESTSDTLDGGKGVHDLVSSIDVSVRNTKNVLEVVVVCDDDRHLGMNYAAIANASLSLAFVVLSL